MLHAPASLLSPGKSVMKRTPTHPLLMGASPTNCTNANLPAVTPQTQKQPSTSSENLSIFPTLGRRAVPFTPAGGLTGAPWCAARHSRHFVRFVATAERGTMTGPPHSTPSITPMCRNPAANGRVERHAGALLPDPPAADAGDASTPQLQSGTCWLCTRDFPCLLYSLPRS